MNINLCSVDNKSEALCVVYFGLFATGRKCVFYYFHLCPLPFSRQLAVCFPFYLLHGRAKQIYLWAYAVNAEAANRLMLNWLQSVASLVI